MTRTSQAVDALQRSYPGRFAPAAARAWVERRRALLADRCGPRSDLGLAVSSGCAATGARAHASGLADDAEAALVRLDAGLGTHCEACGSVLDFDRLDSAPAAVRCAGCVRRYEVDTRWCH